MSLLVPKHPTTDFEAVFPIMEVSDPGGEYFSWDMFNPTLDGQFDLALLESIVGAMRTQQSTYLELSDDDGFINRDSPEFQAELKRARP